jgi:hypothetical protein
MDTPMHDTAASRGERDLPTITVKRMLDMTTSYRRYNQVELTISGVRFSNLQGKPVPHKPQWQQHPGIVVLGQDIDGSEITIEAVGDDMHWLESLSKHLTLAKTVVLEHPTFSGCR